MLHHEVDDNERTHDDAEHNEVLQLRRVHGLALHACHTKGMMKHRNVVNAAQMTMIATGTLGLFSSFGFMATSPRPAQ